MDSAASVFALVVAAYLIGSIPVGYCIARSVADIDIRVAGEGNVGARNVFHEVGAGWGVVTFLADASKGAIVAGTAGRYGGLGSLAVAGVAVVVGHGFPVWLDFIGGKGLATAGGFSAVLIPWAVPASLVLAGAVFALSRSFLPSVVAAIVGGIVVAAVLGYPTGTIVVIVGLFAMTGLKRAIDEPRMRRVELDTGWDRWAGGSR